MDKNRIKPAAASFGLFMCAVTSAVYMLSTEPPPPDIPQRSLGDSVRVSAAVSENAAYDANDANDVNEAAGRVDAGELREAFEAGELDGAALVELFAGDAGR